MRETLGRVATGMRGVIERHVRDASADLLRVLRGQDITTRSHDAATLGRRLSGMEATGSDGNAELAADGPLMRWRSRKVERDSAYGQKALREFATDQVGDGIRPQFDTGKDKLDRQLAADWDEFNYQCDGLNGGTAYGMQHQLILSLGRDGGTLLNRLWRDRGHTDIHGSRLLVPMQMQPLEVDYLSTAKDGRVGDATITNGIEVVRGSRRAYHVHESHPGAQWLFGGMSSGAVLDKAADRILGVERGANVVRIPASDMLHVFPYNLTRPGQITAAPWLHAVILRLWDLDGWMDATMLARRVSASMPGYVTGGDPLASPDLVEPIHPVEQRDAWKVLDGRGYPMELTEPGVIGYLQNGRDIKFPDQPSVPQHEESTRVSLREIAAGTGMAYESLSGDVSQGNFISLRVALLGRRRLMDAIRNQVTIPMLCRPMGMWFLEAMDLANRYKQGRDPVRVTWIPPSREDADEKSRVEIIAAKIRCGLMSWRTAVQMEGVDPDILMEEIRRSNAMFDANPPVILDIDPRRRTDAGVGIFGKPDPDQEAQPVKRPGATNPTP